jgi:hypothetical protein
LSTPNSPVLPIYLTVWRVDPVTRFSLIEGLLYLSVAKNPAVKYCMPVQPTKDFSVAKNTAATAKIPSSYELLGVRVQKIINSTNAQKSRTALLMRLPDELEDEWNQMLGEIAENDNVTLAYRDDGGVQIFWTVPKED